MIVHFNNYNSENDFFRFINFNNKKFFNIKDDTIINFIFYNI